jgi:hypothetical protein
MRLFGESIMMGQPGSWDVAAGTGEGVLTVFLTLLFTTVGVLVTARRGRVALEND